MSTICRMFVAATLCICGQPEAFASYEQKTVGSWTIVEDEPSPGHHVIELTAKEDKFIITLVCLGGPWRVYLAEVSERDSANSLVPINLTYSVDGATPITIAGEGHRRYRFDQNRDANVLVNDILNAKKELAVAIEPRRQFFKIPLFRSREAISPFISRCPLT